MRVVNSIESGRWQAWSRNPALQNQANDDPRLERLESINGVQAGAQ